MEEKRPSMKIEGKKKNRIKEYIPTTRQIRQKYKIAREMASTCTKKDGSGRRISCVWCLNMYDTTCRY